jgi:outer membrane protein TolC
VLAASEQAYGEAMSQREKLRRTLEADLHEAEHNLLVSKKELLLAEQQFKIADNSAKLAQKAYNLGELDLMRLLRIQSQTFEAERSYTTRQLQVKWDTARYNQAVGVLP